jgi:hypothetical protein
MSPVLLTILCLIAYVAGIFIIRYSTSRIVSLQYDEGWFMLIAALDIVGGLLVFAPVGITFALFNAALGVRIIDFIMLAIIIGFSLRLAYRCFRPSSHPDPLRGVVKLSSYIAGGYCVLLIAAAFYALVTGVVIPT